MSEVIIWTNVHHWLHPTGRQRTVKQVMSPTGYQHSRGSRHPTSLQQYRIRLVECRKENTRVVVVNPAPELFAPLRKIQSPYHYATSPSPLLDFVIWLKRDE